MIYNMRGDAYHAGPVMLSDVYTSAVGSAKDGVAASQRALYDAYNSLNSSITSNYNTLDSNLKQSGSYYYKMYDGTLIQWGTKAVTTGTAQGPLGYHGYSTVTFPVPFSNTPQAFASPYDNAGYWNAAVYTTSNKQTQIYLAGDLPSVTRSMNWFAIGKWK